MISEPCTVAAATAVDAWKIAAQLLVEEGDRFNLAVHILQPETMREDDIARYDPRHADSRLKKSIYDIANTIFPTIAAHHPADLDALFTHFQKVYVRGQRAHPSAWGTYFLRLTSWGATGENQIRRIITALTEWGSRPRAALVVHLSSADLDSPRPLGAPCWQFGEFIRTDSNVLSLTAVYRSQDYFQKALGNFAGLTRLLRFVCARSNMAVGTITCLAVYATLQGAQGKTRRLLNR